MQCDSKELYCMYVVPIDVFSQVSDSSGVLVQSKFDAFLKEALKLPTAVHEGPSFGYTQTLAHSCFPQQVWLHTSSLLSLWYVKLQCLCSYPKKQQTILGGIVILMVHFCFGRLLWLFVCFQVFCPLLLSLVQKRVTLNMFLDIVADTPLCLVWLPLMHRLANVEHGRHTHFYINFFIYRMHF